MTGSPATVITTQCKFTGCHNSVSKDGLPVCAEHASALIWEGANLIWPTVDEVAELFLRKAVGIARRIQLSDDGLKAIDLILNAYNGMVKLADEVDKQVPLSHTTRTDEAFKR